jgi:hypothetical protein
MGDSTSDVVIPQAPGRKRNEKGPLVETEVRRSPRIRELNGDLKITMCVLIPIAFIAIPHHLK